MRNASEIKNYAEIYDIQKESPFVIPDENTLAPVDPTALSQYQMVMDWDNAPVPTDAQMDAVRPLGTDGAAGETLLSPATNRGFARYQNDRFPERWGGYDGGVEASIFGKWEGDCLDCLARRLDSGKKAADDGHTVDKYVDIAGIIWEVKPTGATNGFFKYKWVIESHGVKLYIHSNPKKGIIPIRVRFGFECLARTDLFDAVGTLRDVLHSVGFIWETETVSRVDMQVLLPVDIYEFTEAIKGPRVVTRCRGVYQLNASMDTMRVETITLRSKNAELCIYDKRAQIETEDAVYIDTFFKEIIQDDVLPEHLTRVEFRFRRPMLARYGVHTFKDLKESESALPRVFGRDWFRILERDKVRGSENEIEDAPIWKRTMEAFDHYFSQNRSPLNPPRTPDDLRGTPKPVKTPNLERSVKQAAGLMSSVVSYLTPKITQIEDVLEKSVELLKEHTETMYSKCITRQVENAVNKGYSADRKDVFTTIQEIRESVTMSPYTMDFAEFTS